MTAQLDLPQIHRISIDVSRQTASFVFGLSVGGQPLAEKKFRPDWTELMEALNAPTGDSSVFAEVLAIINTLAAGTIPGL